MKHSQCKTNHVHHNSHPSDTRKEHRTAYTMLVLGYLHWQVGTLAKSGTAKWLRARGYAKKLHCPRLTHRGWSEFRNFKFHFEQVISMWADKAQSSPLKDWSFRQVFVKLAKDHPKWYCDTRLQFDAMFASKCGKGAAELIEPGDGDRPEKNHNRMEKKMAAWSWQSHADLTCNFNHLTSFDHFVIFTASMQDIRDIGWLVSLKLDSCKMHQNAIFHPNQCKNARMQESWVGFAPFSFLDRLRSKFMNHIEELLFQVILSFEVPPCDGIPIRVGARKCEKHGISLCI